MRNFLKVHSWLEICHVIVACIICLWLLNPTSANPKELIPYMILWLGLILVDYGASEFLSIIQRKSFLIMWLWIIVMLFYYCFNHMDFALSYILYAFVFIIGFVYLKEDSRCAALLISGVTLMYYAVIAVNTLIAYQTVPAISRILADGNIDNIVARGGGNYITPFIGSFAYVYSLVLLIPMILVMAKNHSDKKKKLFYFALTFLFSYLVIKSQFMIAVLILFMLIAYLLIMEIKSDRSKALVLLISVFIALTVFLFGGGLFRYLSSIVSSTNFSHRLREIGDALTGVGIGASSDIGSRLRLYGVSIDNFFSHPFFGAGEGDILYSNFGNHSTLLDMFAKYGLIGGVTLLLYYVKPFQLIKSAMTEVEISSYRYILIGLFVLSIVNPTDTKPNMLLVYILAPMIIRMSSVSVKG